MHGTFITIAIMKNGDGNIFNLHHLFVYRNRPYVPFHKLADAHALAQSSGLFKSDAWTPSGQQGYIDYNLKFFKSMLTVRKAE